MYNSIFAIQRWLAQAQAQNEAGASASVSADAARPRKRRRVYPSSNSSQKSASPNKKKMEGPQIEQDGLGQVRKIKKKRKSPSVIGDEDDNVPTGSQDQDMNDTHRQRPGIFFKQSQSQSDHSSASGTTTTTSSRAYSPSKQSRKVGAAMLTAAVRLSDLDGSEPPLLKQMARDLRSIGANRHFVWPQLRQSVEERAQTDELFAPLSLSSAGWYTAEVDEPTPHGSLPTVHDIAKILRSAR